MRPGRTKISGPTAVQQRGKGDGDGVSWESPVIRKSLLLLSCPAHVAPDTQRGKTHAHELWGFYVQEPANLLALNGPEETSICYPENKPEAHSYKALQPWRPCSLQSREDMQGGRGMDAGKVLAMHEDLSQFRSQHHVKARSSDSTYNPSTEEAKTKGSLDPARR